ncbi:redoxin domain-containing protein [bacterium]|nr:redoxin domain-containing protein [bacterium]
MLKTGDDVSTLQFEDSDGKRYTSNELKHYKAIAIFFYPKDFTSICTAEVCHFRDRYNEIVQLGGASFGVSLDGDGQHREFEKAYRLPFKLVYDRGKVLGKLFGTLRLGGLLKHKRATFIIGSNGRILDVIHNELNAEIHADRFIEILKASK